LKARELLTDGETRAAQKQNHTSDIFHIDWDGVCSVCRFSESSALNCELFFSQSR